MKLQTAFIVLFLVAQLGCSDDNVNSNAPLTRSEDSNTTLNGTWKVISFEDIPTAKIEYKNQQNSWGTDIVVSFDDTKIPNQLSGRNISNQFGGEFEYVNDQQFKVNSFISTFMSQPAWADKFAEAMSWTVVPFEVSSEKLLLYNESKTKRITLVRADGN